mgnify:CR=1 FL=1
MHLRSTLARTMSPTRLVMALIAAGVVGGAGTSLLAGGHAHAAAPVIAAATLPAGATVAAPDFAQIAQRYGAAVVNISVSGMKKVGGDDADEADEGAQRRAPPGLDPNDPFFEFFRRF